MKARITKILFCALVVVLALACFVACNNDSNKHDVTFMDGETSLGSLQVEDGSALNKAVVEALVAKDGSEFVGLFTDAELTEAFAWETEITAKTTLYVKYGAKQMYISVVAGEGETKVERVAVTAGESYTIAAPTKEGYTFVGYTYINDDDEEVAFATNGNFTVGHSVRLTAKWRLNEYTLTYKSGEENVGTEKVNHGAKATGIDAVAGYTIEGYYTDAEMTADNKVNVKAYVATADATLYVKLVPNVYHITVVNYDAANCDVEFGATYTLPAEPMKEGWASFDGYKFGSATGEAFAATGTYTWTNNIVVYATYTRDEMYNKSTVTLLDDNTQVGTTVVEDGSKIDEYLATIDTEKTGYTFYGWYKDTEFESKFIAETETVNADLTLHAKYVANEYTITYGTHTLNVTYGQAFTMPTLSKLNYVFGGYRYNNATFPNAEDATDLTCDAYLFTTDITVEEVWTIVEGVNFYTDAENHYFKERATSADPYTYVFLTGYTYNFEGQTLSSTADGTEIIINSSRTGFEARIPGEFTLTVGDANVQAKVVYDVTSLQYGNDYTAMIANVDNGTLFQAKLEHESDYVMTVGRTNYKPDMTVMNSSYANITIEDANMVITMTADGNGIAAPDYTITGNAITFNNNDYTSYDEIVLTFAPKYAFGNAPKAFTVKMNNGTNVYNNAELKTVYGDTTNHNVVINILREITAKLNVDDYVDGVDDNIGTLTVYNDGNPQSIANVDLGTPKNMFWEGVYKRSLGTKEESEADNVVINGNFFKIDGSKLPYIGEATPRTEGNAPYVLGNVQIGIFLYRCAEVNAPGAYDDLSGVKWADGTVSMNNLRLVGNNYPEYAGATVDYQVNNTTKQLLKMSTSYDGIIVRGGTMNLDNVSVTNMNLGFMLHGSVSGYYKPGMAGENRSAYSGQEGHAQANETQSTHLNMSNSIIDNCWCNSIYCYDLVALNLSNTRIGSSSGAAIHFDDRPYAKEGSTQEAIDQGLGCSNLNSSLVMDTYTAQNINNWIVGDEPWFTAYAKQSVAMQLKTDLTAGVSPFGLEILRDTASGEKINLAIVVFPNDVSATTAWAQDKSNPSGSGVQAGIDAMMNDVQLTSTLFDRYAFLGGVIDLMKENNMEDIPKAKVGVEGEGTLTLEQVYGLAQQAGQLTAGYLYQLGTPFVGVSNGGMQIFIPARLAN